MPRASSNRKRKRHGSETPPDAAEQLTQETGTRSHGDGLAVVGPRAGFGREPPGRVPKAFESEIRQWLARELHDTVSATLTTMVVQMEQLKRSEDPINRCARTETSMLAELDAFQDLTRDALHDLRRLVQELRDEPAPVTGFVDSVGQMLERFGRSTGISCRLTAADAWPSELGAFAARNLVRIAQEALQNVRTHSAARSVAVSLECSAGLAIMTISDDGIGLEASPPSGGGFGLIGMRERAALVGGEFRLKGIPGRGTTIQAIFPVERLR